MIIEASNLCLVYDQFSDEETYALQNVDVRLPNQGIIGITGPSGSGKSSLLHLLSNLREPTSGTIYYNDIDLSTYSPEELESIRRQRFGFIFQRSFLIDYLSVLDNILVGCSQRNQAAEAKAADLLGQLGLQKQAWKKPGQLSVGQRQKIAVIRALMNDPEVIFADEPTASLDHRSALEVMAVLEMRKIQSTILIVTHDQSLLKSVDDLVELRDGRRV